MVLASFAGIGSLVLNRERVYKLRQTLYSRQKLAQLEVCDGVKRKTEFSGRGQAAFQEWAQQVRRAQKKDSPDKTVKKPIEIEGPQCNQRLPGESWVQYKGRKLREKLHELKGRLREERAAFSEQGFSRWLGDLKARVAQKVLDREDAVAHGLTSLGFHTVWMEYSDSPNRVGNPTDFLDFALEAQGLSPGKPSDQAIGEWVHVLSDQFFSVALPEVSTIKGTRPSLKAGVSSMLCDELIADSSKTSETEQMRRYLQIAIKSCKAKQCDSKLFTRAITLACVLKGPVGSELFIERKQILWPGISPEVPLDLGILHVPQDFLSLEGGARNGRIFRLSHEFARVLDPAFFYRAPFDEAPKDPAVTVASLALLQGPGFALTRLGALSFFTPFSEGDLASRLEPYSGFFNFREKMQDLIQQFRVAYIAHKGVL